jgi:rod shape determining protein RodA
VFFAPRDNPQIAGVIFAEHGEHGYLGAPIAKHVIDTYFAKKEGGRCRSCRCRRRRPASDEDPDSPPALPAVDVADARGGRVRHHDRRRPLPRDRLMFERRLHFHIDWAMLIALMALCLLGLAQIYSATGGPTRTLRHQIYGIVLGLVALLICLTIDYRTLADKSHFVYGGIVLLLVYVLFLGVVRGGSRRWIDLGPLNLQPSEFAKGDAGAGPRQVLRREPARRHLAQRPADCRRHHRRAVRAHCPAADLGTAVTLVPVLFATAFLGGMSMRIVGILALAGILIAPVAWKFALQDYQKERISTFLDPSQDAKGAGYQQIQARITVGSGGVWGKGFQKGTQGQLRFLPVAHNDFIFSVLAEERGFAGVVVALGLYLFVILRALEAAVLAKDRLGSFLVLGVLASFVFQVVYNITMSAGLAPVKGLTLPLMSYGGSSMIATLAGFGLILNVRMRRFTN